ncbi:MAG TPA: DNA-binding domain-containing protein [Gammaproteobacteria bacterium]
MNNMLTELQTEFQDYILGRSDRALARIESTAALPAERRLDIYHNAYRARLAEVMADTYERVVLYIGEESFENAAWAYIEGHPPITRNVRDYGRTLPEFLATYFADDPEVAELAGMDARLRYTFDALDADALGVSDVAIIQPQEWESVAFTLHPAVSFQQFHWNTPAIWLSLSEEAAPPAAEQLSPPVVWLFWRKELQPHFRSLSGAEHAALQAAADGQTFGAICSLLAEHWPELDVTTNLAAWLRTWLDDGVLAKVL